MLLTSSWTAVFVYILCLFTFLVTLKLSCLIDYIRMASAATAVYPNRMMHTYTRVYNINTLVFYTYKHQHNAHHKNCMQMSTRHSNENSLTESWIQKNEIFLNFESSKYRYIKPLSDSWSSQILCLLCVKQRLLDHGAESTSSQRAGNVPTVAIVKSLWKWL